MEAFVLVWMIAVGNSTNTNTYKVDSGTAPFPSEVACLTAQKNILTDMDKYNKMTERKFSIHVISMDCYGNKRTK
jgi:hypothetical protein